LCTKVRLTVFNNVHISGSKQFHHKTVEGKVQ